MADDKHAKPRVMKTPGVRKRKSQNTKRAPLSYYRRLEKLKEKGRIDKADLRAGGRGLDAAFYSNPELTATAVLLLVFIGSRCKYDGSEPNFQDRNIYLPTDLAAGIARVRIPAAKALLGSLVKLGYLGKRKGNPRANASDYYWLNDKLFDEFHSSLKEQLVASDDEGGHLTRPPSSSENALMVASDDEGDHLTRPQVRYESPVLKSVNKSPSSGDLVGSVDPALIKLPKDDSAQAVASFNFIWEYDAEWAQNWEVNNMGMKLPRPAIMSLSGVANSLCRRYGLTSLLTFEQFMRKTGRIGKHPYNHDEVENWFKQRFGQEEAAEAAER